MDDAALRARRLASQWAFYERLGRASPGARFDQLGDGAVGAAFVPVRPDRSVVNAVVYSDADALLGAHEELADRYERAGTLAWTVWVPGGDRRVTARLQAAGHAIDGRPREMGARLDDLDLDERVELDLDPEPSWPAVAELNEAAYARSAGGAYLGPPFAGLQALLYVARLEGRPAAGLAIFDVDDDVYVAMVATRPEAQRRGLASELLRLALREAQGRGMRTTTLEASPAGAPVYGRLGYRDLGVIEMWERRVRNEPA